MEKKNNVKTQSKKQQQMGAVNTTGSSSSSSFSSGFATDLFGPKVSSESSTSSSGLFESVFGPSSMGLGRPSTYYNGVMYSNTTKSGTPDGATQRGMDYKNKNSMFEGGERPCNFTSSIYYGAQEVYSPTTNHTTCSHHHTNYFKKEEVEDDENGNNSNCASRGNWWQGSLYY